MDEPNEPVGRGEIPKMGQEWNVRFLLRLRSMLQALNLVAAGRDCGLRWCFSVRFVGRLGYMSSLSIDVFII